MSAWTLRTKTLPNLSLNRLAATIKQGHELVHAAALRRLAVKREAFAGRNEPN